MTSSVKMIEPTVAKMSIEVPREDVDAAMNKAYAMISRSANIRGFRKGKAPRAVVRRMYGKAVRNDIKGDLMNTHFLNAFTEHQLEPISTPEIEADELEEGAPFRFTATFQVRPKLEKVDYKGIEIERNKVTVEEKDVTAELERVRATLATVTEISEPRPAQTGDVAAVSMKRWVDGKWQDGGLPDQEIVIGDGHAPEQIEEALKGMNVEDEKVVDLGSEEELEENRMRYLIHVSAIKERKLPALDDELAKDTGNYDTLDALKADVEKRILDARTQSEDQRVRSALFEALCKQNEMDLPDSMVERHTEALKNQFFGGMIQPTDDDDEKKQETIQKLSEGAENMARSMVHQHLLMMEIARIENLSVTDEEIDAEIERQAKLANIPVPMLRAEMGKKEKRQELSSNLLEKKIFDFAKSLVKISEEDGSKAASEDEASEAPAASKKSGQKTKKKTAAAKKSAAEKSPAKKTTEKKKATKATAKKAEGKKSVAKKDTAKKDTAKKTATKKTSAKKTAAKKTATKKK